MDIVYQGQTVSHQGLKDRAPKSRTVLEIRGQLAPMARADSGGGGMGIVTPPNDFKKPRPSWSEV